MSTQDDQARAIAERVARRLGGDTARRVASNSISASEPLSTPEPPRARIIDFVASGPPLRSAPQVSRSSSITPTVGEPVRSAQQTEFFQFVPVTQSPWLGRLPSMLGAASPQAPQYSSQPAEHSSQERFGVEEAAVTELVEFFENEKKCSVDPSGKPCDHCAMCSSRGF
jgi:hypothetical protein